MSLVENIYGVFTDTLSVDLVDLRRNRAISNRELAWLCENIISDVAKIRDMPRRFPERANISDEVVNDSLTLAGHHLNGSTPSNRAARQNAEPVSSKAADATRIGILKLLGSESRALSLDDVMAGLKSMELAEEKHRNTIISTLRRLRREAELIVSPYKGYYELTDQGRTVYAQYAQPPAK